MQEKSARPERDQREHVQIHAVARDRRGAIALGLLQRCFVKNRR
jgi:hypothetical protein